MGYLKRKRTKRRGKKGTKKYRGGMSLNSTGNATQITGINEKFKEESSTEPSTETPPSGNAAKEEAKAKLLTKIDALKTALNEFNIDTPDFSALKTTMGEAMTAIDALST